MKSVKELTEKLKNLDLQKYDVRCCSETNLTSSKKYNDYDIIVKSHSIDEDFRIMIVFWESGITLRLTDLNWYQTSPYFKSFNKETYSKKEEAELVAILEEIKEHSDATMLNTFNSFLK
jgi:hypothetical protein